MSTPETIWAFDLGKASIGEAVRVGNDFPHKASLLMPADFAETRTAATRRRMWRTRTAHRERERWLEQVWAAAGLPVLYGRNRDPETGGEKVGTLADERLEREFAETGDNTCYTSCLLRIKLLRGEKLADWQIFKALRSAMQKRGYDPDIPWKTKEARRAGKSVEDMERDQGKQDPHYREAIEKWDKFKATVPEGCRFPCYYDAWKMGLWTPEKPNVVKSRTDHMAGSTRNIRFARADVELEIGALARNADCLLQGRLEKARDRLVEDMKQERLARIRAVNARRQAKNAGLPPAKQKRLLPEPTFENLSTSIGDFICSGPAGKAYASYYADVRTHVALRTGSADDWMGALGQKIPRFDNRILDDCVLIPRFHVCKAEIRQDTRTGAPVPDSLLPAEVTFLMKLKNTLVGIGKDQRKLRVDEVRRIFAVVSQDAAQAKADAKDWPKKIAGCFALSKADWGRTKGIKELALRPLPGHEEVKSPKDAGRSGFSRPALRLLKELILSGKKPVEFHGEQFAKLNGNTDPKKGLVLADLKFLLDMPESWEDIHVPAQKLDALAVRHTEDGRLDVEKAVADLLGGINDPVVRHRLGVFARRLKFLRDGDGKKHKGFGVPDEIVLEFVRTDFMGPKRLADLRRFQSDREKARKRGRKPTKPGRKRNPRR
jgi:CRISPR-associated endonuclease Csn1